MPAVECADTALRRLEAAELANGLRSRYAYARDEEYPVTGREDPQLEAWGQRAAEVLRVPPGASYGFASPRQLHRAMAAFIIGECYAPPGGRRISWRAQGRKSTLWNYPDNGVYLSQLPTTHERSVVLAEAAELWSADRFGWVDVLGVALAYAKVARAAVQNLVPAASGPAAPQETDPQLVGLAQTGLLEAGESTVPAYPLHGKPEAYAYLQAGQLRIGTPCAESEAEAKVFRGPFLQGRFAFGPHDSRPLVEAAVTCYGQDRGRIPVIARLFGMG